MRDYVMAVLWGLCLAGAIVFAMDAIGASYELCGLSSSSTAFCNVCSGAYVTSNGNARLVRCPPDGAHPHDNPKLWLTLLACPKGPVRYTLVASTLTVYPCPK